MAGLQRIFKNMGAALFGRALTILPQFVVPSLFVHRYSPARFGEWGVISGAVGALAILNFGVQTYMNQDLAVRYNRGEFDNVHQRQSTAIRLLLGGCSVAAALGLIIFLLPIDRWLHLDIGRLAAQASIYFLGSQILLNVLYGYLTGIYLGVLMAHRGVMWNIFNSFLMSLFMIICILFRFSFPVIAISQVLAYFISAPIVLIDLKRKAPGIFPRLDYWSPEIARQILAPSGYFGLIELSTFLAYQVPLVILQIVLGPVAVAFFIVMRTLFSTCRQILSIFTQSISTEVTTLFARRDNVGLMKLYDFSERFIYFIIPLTNTTMLMLSPVLVRYWMGKGSALFSVYPYVLAAAISMVASLKEHKYQFQASTNTHEQLAKVMFFSYLAMGPVSCVAVHFLGVVGFLWTWLAVELIQMARITQLNVRLFAHVEKLDLRSLRLLITVCSACLLAASYTLRHTCLLPFPIQVAIAAVFAAVVFACAFPVFHMRGVFVALAGRVRRRNRPAYLGLHAFPGDNRPGPASNSYRWFLRKGTRTKMGLLNVIAQHGYAVVGIVLFCAAAGMPLPTSIVLLIAGAEAHHTMRLEFVLPIAWACAVLGDSLLYIGGRYTGWWLLAGLCRFSINPEGCIFTSSAYFYRRGAKTLLFAKFIPGLASMAAPLAGSLNMRFWRFLRLDMTGVAFYVSTWILIGYIFSHFLHTIIAFVQHMGHAVSFIVLLTILIYAASLVVFSIKARKYNKIQKISAEELRERLQSLTPDKLVVIADVRSHNYYDPGMQRIKNSIRVEPTRLKEELEALREFMAPECEIYLYCSCIRDTTSKRVAHMLQQENCRTSVIEGGIKAWIRAGGELESVPAADIQHLPRFE